MGQWMLGIFTLAAVVAAFWMNARMAPRRTIRAEEALAAGDHPPAWSTDLLLTVMGSLGTAAAFGASLVLHRWPDAAVYSFNLGALIALLVVQVWAIEDRAFRDFPLKAGAQGRLAGFVCTVYGFGLFRPPNPGHRWDLAFLLFMAVSVAVSLLRETRGPARHETPAL